MFIAVRGKAARMAEVPAYLYSGQTVATEPVTGIYGTFVIVDTGSADAYTANYVAGRLQSGMFGAKVFDTMAEAEAYVESEKD
jgi:hypothetical protein